MFLEAFNVLKALKLFRRRKSSAKMRTQSISGKDQVDEVQHQTRSFKNIWSCT